MSSLREVLAPIGERTLRTICQNTGQPASPTLTERMVLRIASSISLA
jgi:hypothetical protein